MNGVVEIEDDSAKSHMRPEVSAQRLPKNPAVEIRRARLWLNDRLCVAEPCLPIAWLAPRWRDGYDVNLVLVVQIHQRELERPVDDAARLELVPWPQFRRLGGLRFGFVNRLVVAFCELSADATVVADLAQKLVASFRVIPDGSHRRNRRRASA